MYVCIIIYLIIKLLIKLYYSEIIGYVDAIESPRRLGTKMQYKFFKFYLNNGNGKRVQIVAWNDDVEIIEPHIMVNYVSILIIN